jgi:antitoxin HicB
MNNPHIGSDFDSFLEEEGVLSDAEAVAVKRVIAFQLQQAMDAQHMTKTTLAKKMHTSRASLNRLLDDTDTSLTLTTLSNAAKVLGQKITINLNPIG